VRVLATADIHSPRYLATFKSALAKLGGPANQWCALLLAGDLIDRGRIEMLSPVIKFVKDSLGNIEVIAVFGNEEYEEVRGKLRKLYPNIVWLEDEAYYLSCGRKKVAIVGTTGALDRPTSWQRKHKPFLEKVYRERPRVIERLIREAKSKSDYVVLLSHYVVAKGNLKGEDPRAWPEMYSKLMEEVVARGRPDVVVHGHAHKGSRFTLVSGVPVYNVALPLRNSIVEIELRARGLDAFF